MKLLENRGLLLYFLATLVQKVLDVLPFLDILLFGFRPRNAKNGLFRYYTCFDDKKNYVDPPYVFDV